MSVHIPNQITNFIIILVGRLITNPRGLKGVGSHIKQKHSLYQAKSELPLSISIGNVNPARPWEYRNAHLGLQDTD